MRRYPKYKESGIEWLGEIPEHWELRPLKYTGKIVLGKMLTNDDKGGYFKRPYLRAQNIIWEHVDIDDIKEMWFSENELKQYRLREDDILVSEGGEVGRTAIWKNELNECYIQNSVHKITVNSGNDPNYYLYHFQFYGKTGFFESIVSKVSIAHLTREKLKDIRFLSPQPTEQQNIKNYLLKKTNQIDTFIKNKQTQIDLLKEYRTAIINEAVTKGLNPNVKMKDSGIEWLGEIPEHWDIIRVKHLAGNDIDVVQTGPFGAQLHASDYVDEGIPLILIRNVNNLQIDDSNIPKISEKKAESLSMYRLDIGDILFSRVGSIGRIAIVKEREEGWMISGQMLRIRLNNPQLFNHYAVYVFISSLVSEFIKFKSVGSTRESINTEILRNAPLTIPPYREQQRIINYIESETNKIGQSIDKIEHQIQLLQQYRTSLISEVVTGKIDVRDEVQ